MIEMETGKPATIETFFVQCKHFSNLLLENSNYWIGIQVLRRNEIVSLRHAGNLSVRRVSQ
jgi:hypothetical protein